MAARAAKTYAALSAGGEDQVAFQQVAATKAIVEVDA
jgi:hypothetical protein